MEYLKIFKRRLWGKKKDIQAFLIGISAKWSVKTLVQSLKLVCWFHYTAPDSNRYARHAYM